VADLTLRTGNLPETEVSAQFLQGIVDRRALGFHKYGPASGGKSDYTASIPVRLAKYAEDGNTEWLMDIATYAMLEFMNPRHPGAHYRATTSDESPGDVLVGGAIWQGGPAPVFHRHEGD
jgi:hypothetical protein